MIENSDLEVCSEKLRIYDVVQGGWVHEPRGFKDNAVHTLTHLSLDEVKKDFNDPLVVRGAIAPDSLQYAFRVMRWTNQPILDVDIDKKVIVEFTQDLGDQLRLGNLGLVARMAAKGELAQYVHDIGHDDKRKEAMANRKASMRRMAGLLIFSAELQAERYKFDPVEAFDARLAQLRQRFGIPEPDL